jgi:hypothetical protein
MLVVDSIQSTECAFEPWNILPFASDITATIHLELQRRLATISALPKGPSIHGNGQLIRFAQFFFASLEFLNIPV